MASPGGIGDRLGYSGRAEPMEAEHCPQSRGFHVTTAALTYRAIALMPVRSQNATRSS